MAKVEFDWSKFNQEKWIVTHEFSSFQQKIKIGIFNDERVAIKIGANLENEIRVMSFIPPHPNIIRFISVIDDGDFLMEGVKDGLTLRDYCRSFGNDEKSFTLEQLVDLLNQMAQGLNHLHQNRIIHHDFTNRNVLVHFGKNESIVLKITDFGISEFMDENGHGDPNNRELGTYNFLAPEQKTIKESKFLQSNINELELYAAMVPEQKVVDKSKILHPITEKIDVYAFGVICSMLIYVGRSNDRVVFCLPENLEKMIFICQYDDPTYRPRMIDCINLFLKSPHLPSLKDQIAEMRSAVLNQSDSSIQSKVSQYWEKCKDLFF